MLHMCVCVLTRAMLRRSAAAAWVSHEERMSAEELELCNDTCAPPFACFV